MGGTRLRGHGRLGCRAPPLGPGRRRAPPGRNFKLKSAASIPAFLLRTCGLRIAYVLYWVRSLSASVPAGPPGGISQVIRGFVVSAAAATNETDWFTGACRNRLVHAFHQNQHVLEPAHALGWTRIS